MKNRILYNIDGSVMVMTPNPNTRLEKETEAEHLERNYQAYISTHPQYGGLEYEDMDTSKLPSDRANRGKWRKSPAGKGVIIDASVVTSAELRMADKAALQAERDKPAPNMKVALDLLLKLQENNY